MKIMHNFVSTNKVNVRISRTDFVQFFIQIFLYRCLKIQRDSDTIMMIIMMMVIIIINVWN